MGNVGYYVEDNSNIDDKKYEAAKNLFLSGNYSDALKIYLDIIRTSYSYKMYYEAGRCYYKMGNYKEEANRVGFFI